eukprot:3912089-Rhodomonas_salina.4
MMKRGTEGEREREGGREEGREGEKERGREGEREGTASAAAAFSALQHSPPLLISLCTKRGRASERGRERNTESERARETEREVQRDRTKHTETETEIATEARKSASTCLSMAPCRDSARSISASATPTRLPILPCPALGAGTDPADRSLCASAQRGACGGRG